jgi:dipeptidyl aminopeptidase/acylaminoacyl peptidase
MVWEDRRTVDYLLSRPEVDPERIACLGLSMGGFRTNLLASLDDRVRAAVSVGWITTLRETFPHHFYSTMGWMKIIPGLHKCLDLTDVMALIPPRKLLVIDGEKDPLFSREGVRDAHAQLRGGFAKAGASESLRLSTYPQGHVFNLQMQQEAWEFLKGALR